MDTSPSIFWAFLTLVETFFFGAWPLLIPVSGFPKRGKIKLQSVVLNMFITWVLFAIAGILILFNPERVETPGILLIGEPFNTILFVVTGIILAGLSFWMLTKQQKIIIHKAKGINSSKDLLELSPREFEDMTVELFRAFGHQAKRTGQSGDHGVDVMIQAKNGEKCVVQCKRWKGSVGESIIRDFYGVMMHEKADRGFIITSGKFSKPAREWARGKPISLYDGEKFVQLWKKTQTKREVVATPQSAEN